MTSHRNMRILTASPARNEIIFAINAGIDRLHAELFPGIPIISAKLLLLVICKPRKSDKSIR